MTNQRITFEALDEYFLNTQTGKLNADYLRECVFDVFNLEHRHENSRNGRSKLFYLLQNKRRKNAALIWEAFLHFANRAIADQYYSARYMATSEQLKKYLAKYGYTYDIFTPLYEELDELRAEQEETAK